MSDDRDLINAIETARDFADRAWATLISNNTAAEAKIARLTKANAELREAAAEYLEVCPVLRTHPIGAPNSKARERQAREIQSADKLIVALDNSSEGE